MSSVFKYRVDHTTPTGRNRSVMFPSLQNAKLLYKSIERSLGPGEQVTLIDLDSDDKPGYNGGESKT